MPGPRVPPPHLALLPDYAPDVAPEPLYGDPGKMDREEYLSRSLAQLERYALGAYNAGSWQAIAQLKRTALAIRRELDLMREANDKAGWDPKNVDLVVREVTMLGPEVLRHPVLRAAVLAAEGGP